MASALSAFVYVFEGEVRLGSSRLSAHQLAVLGVHDLHVIGLPDGGCADSDDAGMVALIADHIDDLGADVVVTFGPDGITGHADHLAVSRWATAAAHSRAELLYATMTHDFVDRHRALHDAIGRYERALGAMLDR